MTVTMTTTSRKQISNCNVDGDEDAGGDVGGDENVDSDADGDGDAENLDIKV
jgi:hypothetical protein